MLVTITDMDTIRKSPISLFWIWIPVAFIVGAVVGVVAFIVLMALIS